MGALRVQYGAGWSDAPGWVSFDASPALFVERLPLIGRYLKGGATRFPEGIRYGDIVRGLPVAPGTVTAVYASHVLEHLSYEDCRAALQNTFEMMAPGGHFRLIVPDLKARAERYLLRSAASDPDASHQFMRETFLGRESSSVGFMPALRRLLGHSTHLWMWDEASMAKALYDAGFVEIRRCELGDSADPAFAVLEDPGRFRDGNTGDIEVALSARRPQ